jgi:N-acetylglucosamine-6-sulfatase
MKPMVPTSDTDGTKARRMKKTFPIVAVLIVFTSVTLASSTVATSPAIAAASVDTRPDVVVIVTDDQAPGTEWAMPQTTALLPWHFTRAYSPNSVCCPARATILTGDYSHHNGTWGNNGPFGGFSSFDDSQPTIPVAMHDAGYHTAWIGKYLNHYGDDTGGTYIPPGWDEWNAFINVGYYDGWSWSDNGTPTLGTTYSTDFLGDQAVKFINGVPTNEPLFSVVVPFAPHKPSVPRVDQAGTQPLEPFRPPSYNTPIRKGPEWVAAKSHLDRKTRAETDQLRQDMMETLLSVDEMVPKIVAALDARGRDSLVIFTSDNGYLYGEHRLRGKNVPYHESTRIPMWVRWQGNAGDDPRLVGLLDIAPTAAEVAGVPFGADGQSLFSSHRKRIIVEGEYKPGRPAYCGAYSQRFSYVRYGTGEEEFYDLASDPYQMVNRVDHPRFAKKVRWLRDWVKSNCKPRPPGFSWNP